MSVISKHTHALQKPVGILISHQKVQEERLRIEAINAANSTHAGYKTLLLNAEHNVYKTRDKEHVSYIGNSTLSRNVDNGTLNTTHHFLDFGITGKGYFAVNTPSGVRYTRNGRFMIDHVGRLVTHNGHVVLNQNLGEIAVGSNPSSFFISRDGTMSINGRSAGKIGVFKFEDEQTMRLEGSSLLNASEPGVVSNDYVITQGSFEESNTSMIDVGIKLIDLLHRYEDVQNAIQVCEQKEQKIINVTTNA